MPLQIRDVQESIQERLDAREIKHKPFLATIQSVHGSVHPSNRPDYVWIAENAQPESRHVVFNNRVTPVAGLQVWVQQSPNPPHQLEIAGVYVSAADPGSTIGPLSLPNHAKNHQYPSEAAPGNDPVLIYQPALQPFKTTGNGVDKLVLVQPYIYHVAGVRYVFAGTGFNLTAYSPSAGNDRRILIYLDLTDHTVKLLLGSQVPTATPSVAPYPDVPANSVPSAYVLLQDGQTAITTADHIDDTRDLWGANNVGALQATQIGQIMYSTDGSTFTAQLPLVNNDGIMLTVDGYILV